MITGLHHAQITVPPKKVDACREFYCGVLGLEEVPKPKSLQGRGGFWLAVGSHSVHVGIEDGVDREKTKAHVAYAVRDLASWRNKLGASGIEVMDGVPIPGFDRFEFRDPFGNRVELTEPTD